LEISYLHENLSTLADANSLKWNLKANQAARNGKKENQRQSKAEQRVQKKKTMVGLETLDLTNQIDETQIW